jgi:DNA-binding NtrC family response regulator
MTYKEMFLQWEKGILMKALRDAGGNQGVAAQALGIHRNTLSRKLIECGVTADEIEDTKFIRIKLHNITNFRRTLEDRN